MFVKKKNRDDSNLLSGNGLVFIMTTCPSGMQEGEDFRCSHHSIKPLSDHR